MAGTVNVVELEDGTRRYRARYRDVAGRQHERRFRRKVDAQRWLDEQTSALVTQTWTAPERGRVTHQQRTVPISSILVEPLPRRCQGRGPDDHDVVLTSPGGAVLRSGNIPRRFFDPAAVAAGLEDLSPHDLRHTAASLMVASGANVKSVQRMLGHASAAMTLDLYSGLFDDDHGALAERMDAARDALKTSRTVGIVGT